MRRGGYRPLALTLSGFKGIKSGLGRDTLSLDLEALAGDASLVAIAGANGRGKSTVMDNLHPYLVMPSRAGADGFGAFSYYDHVFLPESIKELVWEHCGQRYRTQLVFRMNGKRKTEAFLFEQNGDAWCPVALPDGTVSDGKVDTYERVVRDILGPQETFFMSVFSAQGKRQLSAYKNGEIKTLLADLLGLEQVREQGARAAETVKLLKGGLAILRQEQATLDSEIAKLGTEAVDLGRAELDVAQASAAKAAAAQALEQARGASAAVAGEAQAAQVHLQRRAELTVERDRLVAADQAAQKRMADDRQRLCGRVTALAQRSATRQRQHAERRAQLVRLRDAQRSVCVDAARVAWALRRQHLAERLVELRAERAEVAQGLAEKADELRSRGRVLRQQVDGIQREAGQLALRQADLQRRFGLTAEVPCAGSDLQGRCKLLADAREAHSLRPAVDTEVASLAERKRAIDTELARVMEDLKPLASAAARRNEAERRFEQSQARASRFGRLAAREGEIQQAEAALVNTERDLAEWPEDVPAETQEEAAERAELAKANERLDAEVMQATGSLQEASARIDAALSALPGAFDVRRIEQCRMAVAQAEHALLAAEQAHLSAVRRHERLGAVREQLERSRATQASLAARADAVAQEIGTWVLLAKCLSNDGVIALDIDDAGPTLASLANDLLLACYGPRFTLEIRTQVETAKGEAREGFDILVHDGQAGESKSVTLLSGGERVWINECLTRAIALYLAGNAGGEYGTLFCDEADGPLDPDRKRMFMDMKREVLRLGGYRREFFVSQTPELTAIADRIIDLDRLVLAAEVA
jgi:exonuclease SbcC